MMKMTKEGTMMAKKTMESNPLNTEPMTVKAKIYNVNMSGNPRANLSLSLNDAFVVNGVKLMERADGELFTAMPSYRQGNGKYQDICYPLTPELREEINQVAITAYNQALGQLQEQNTPPFPEPAEGMEMRG